MRRKDKEINKQEWIDRVIRESLVCRLAMSLNNQPYLVPLSFGYDGLSLYFHTAKTGSKINYFEANPVICFEFEANVRLIRSEDNACDWSMHYESVIGFGDVVELIDYELKINGLNQIMLQYSGREWVYEPRPVDNTRVWKINIHSMSGKHSINKAV